MSDSLVEIVKRLQTTDVVIKDQATADVYATSGDGFNLKDLNYHLRYITYTSHTRDWISMNNQWPGTTLNTVGHDYTFLTNNDDLDWRKMPGRQFVIVDRATRWSQVQIYTVNNDVTIHYVATEPRHHYFQFTASLDAVIGSEFAAYDEVTVKVPDIDGRHLEDASYPMDTPDTFTVTAQADGHLLEIAGNDASLDNGFQYWEVEQADDTGGTGSVVYIYGQGNLPTTLDVDPGTGKYYRIRAMSILGDYSDWSAWSSEIIYGPTPAQAAWVDHTYTTFDGHLMTWEHDLPGSVDYFHIFRNTSASDSGATLVGAYNRNATSALIAYSSSLGDYFGIRAVGYTGAYAATVWSSKYDSAGAQPVMELYDTPGYAVVGLDASDTTHTDPALAGYKVEIANDGSGTGATTLDALRPYAGFPYQVAQAVLSTKYYRLTPISKSGTSGTATAWTALTVTAAEGGFKDYFDGYGLSEYSILDSLSYIVICDCSNLDFFDSTDAVTLSGTQTLSGSQSLKFSPTSPTGMGIDVVALATKSVDWDLSQGNVFTDDDYLVMSLYVEDVGSSGTMTLEFTIGSDLTDVYVYRYQATTTGWKYFKVKRDSPYSGAGTVDWANIAFWFIEIGPGVGGDDPVVYIDDIRLIKADPDDATTFNDTGAVWNFTDRLSNERVWHIYAGNRAGEPDKPFALGHIENESQLNMAYVDGLDIETGTVQVGAFAKSGTTRGIGLAFFISDTTPGSWDLYMVYHQPSTLYLARHNNGANTNLASISYSISAGETVWLGVDLREFQTDPGRLKVYASKTEGNLIQASNLVISHKDTSPHVARGTVGVVTYGANARFFNFSAGSPAHAEVADIARALDGPVLNGLYAQGSGIAVGDDLVLASGSDVYPDGSANGLNARFEQLFGDDVTPIGSTFPGSPATGQVFFRSDVGLLCYYDGTRWLTVAEYAMQVPAVTFTTTTAYALGSFRTNYAPYITRVRTSILIGATNNGANYWNIAWRGINATYTGATTIKAETTSADGTSQWVQKEGAPSTASPSSTRSMLDFSVAATGSPSSISVVGTLFYRLVVT